MVSPANIGEFNRNVKKPVEELEKASQSKLLRLFASEARKAEEQLVPSVWVKRIITMIPFEAFSD